MCDTLILQSTKIVKDLWTHIIQTNNIDLNKYISLITSVQIKNSKKTWNGIKNSQFEPRLLCKMDSSNSRPKIFINNVNISNLYDLKLEQKYFLVLHLNRIYLLIFVFINNILFFNLSNKFVIYGIVCILFISKTDLSKSDINNI